MPSDKSIAHRALICAALAAGESRIGLRTPGEDVRSTLRALRSLGVRAEATELEEGVEVGVSGLGDVESIGRLAGGVGDCGNSGTTMRLLAGALASGAGRATLVGDESLSRRPMERVADPLRAMGADIDLDRRPRTNDRARPAAACAPSTTSLPVASAQVLGAISLAALAADGHDHRQRARAARDHTERMLGALGADIKRTTDSNGTTTSITGPGRAAVVRDERARRHLVGGRLARGGGAPLRTPALSSRASA